MEKYKVRFESAFYRSINSYWTGVISNTELQKSDVQAKSPCKQSLLS